ncbi:Hypp1597 [Branchiostoma lanceolatum]|uniref:Hypp1597 protein n=1 Tax=Branchiostoma lanceolatum TaxID=7740 RepID=A0A8K0EPJ0_BRALA|nr:Hypp1597 [Branchiostoma lanceolatum]
MRTQAVAAAVCACKPGLLCNSSANLPVASNVRYRCKYCSTSQSQQCGQCPRRLFCTNKLSPRPFWAGEAPGISGTLWEKSVRVRNPLRWRPARVTHAEVSHTGPGRGEILSAVCKQEINLPAADDPVNIPADRESFGTCLPQVYTRQAPVGRV